MLINKISNISFKENNTNRAYGTENAILMLRDPNASVRFQQNKEVARKADALSTDPITALGYKLYRTFNMIKDNEPVSADSQKTFNTLA